MPYSLSSRGRPVSLPIPGGAAGRLLEAAASESASVQSVVATLDSDPLLANRLRVLAGSELMDGRRYDGTLSELVMSLESGVLRHAMVTAAVVHLLPPPGTPGEEGRFDRYRLWEHSAATGALARRLSSAAGLDPLDGFVSGLLHDMGRLVLDVYFPREFSAVLQYQARHDTWIRDAEASVLGYDHCLLGEQVAGAWGLPSALAEVMAAHHQPERTIPAPASNMAVVVHVADILARGLQVGSPGDDTLPMLSDAGLRRLGLNWSHIRDCLDASGADMREARRLVRELREPE